jgi:hypothetical protein
MAKLYADEDFPLPVVAELRRLGHDVLTVLEAGRAGLGICDAEVLDDATADDRTVLTHNHLDYQRLHKQGVPHQGIVSCTRDGKDPTGLAQRIDVAVTAAGELKKQFIRVVRPNPSARRKK